MPKPRSAAWLAAPAAILAIILLTNLLFHGPGIGSACRRYPTAMRSATLTPTPFQPVPDAGPGSDFYRPCRLHRFPPPGRNWPPISTLYSEASWRLLGVCGDRERRRYTRASYSTGHGRESVQTGDHCGGVSPA